MKNRKWIVATVALGTIAGTGGNALYARGNVASQKPTKAATGSPTAPRPQEDRAARLRQELAHNGFTDTAVQDAIIAYAAQRGEAGRALHDQERALGEALHDETSTDEQITTLLANLRAAVQTEITRRDAAETALEATINYSANPRLEAFLTLHGFIGDEAGVLGGGRPGGPGGPGGHRGPGGPGGPGRPDGPPPPPDGPPPVD